MTDFIPGKTKSAHLGTDARDFGVTDTKGRKIGSRVSFLRVEYIAHSAEEIAAAEANPAHYSIIDAQHAGKTRFAMIPQATRNGIEYGASQPGKYYETHAEAQAAAETYFAGAAKRAEKIARK